MHGYCDGGQVLENVNNTIQGEGSIGFAHGVQFLNDAAGTVLADVTEPAPLSLFAVGMLGRVSYGLRRKFRQRAAAAGTSA